MEHVKKRFGAAVRRRRKELGLSMDELARRSGLHRTYVIEVELGKRNIALENVEKIARALDLNIGELFDRYGVDPKEADDAGEEGPE